MGTSEYTVTVNGVETVLNLSDEEAKARGLNQDAPTQEPAAEPAAQDSPGPVINPDTNREPDPSTKGSTIEIGRQDEKAVTAANKARAAANKAGASPDDK